MKQRLFMDIQEIEICRLYFKDRLSTYKLGEQFECSYSTIRRVIKRNNFKLRSKSEAMSEAQKGKLGVKSNNWKGGRKRTVEGYILILKSNHPYCNLQGYILEHRLIMERYIGRYLKSEEVVHHKNGMQDDNRIKNLILFQNNKEHLNWHKLQKKKIRANHTGQDGIKREVENDQRTVFALSLLPG